MTENTTVTSNAFGTLQGAQKQITGIQRFTGLAPVQPLLVNPSFEELCQILEVDPANAGGLDRMCNYEVRSNFDGSAMIRTYTFWLYSPLAKSHIPTQFKISDAPLTTKDGNKFKFINRRGQISYWAASAQELIDNPNIPWFSTEGLRNLMSGEDMLYDWIQKLIKYDSRQKGANFMETMEGAGITPETLYNGDALQSLRDLLQYADSNNNDVIMLHIVKEKEGEDGKPSRFYQEVLSSSETTFANSTGNVTQTMINKVTSLVNKKEEEGYSLTKRFFTIPFQEFNKAECWGQADIPENTINKKDSAVSGWAT